MSPMWTISLPLAVAISKKKQFILNLNRYRNAHFQTLNKAKVEFERVVTPLLKNVPKLTIITMEYVYYHGKGQRPDTNNVCTVADKFFADTLVSAGILPDDGPDQVIDTRFKPGGRDRNNPRIEAIIRSAVQERNKHMKASTNINISPAEVQLALRDFLIKEFPPAKNAESLDFKQNGDGSFDVKFDANVLSKDAAEASGKPAKAAKQAAPTQASLPVVSLSASLPPRSEAPVADPMAGAKELFATIPTKEDKPASPASPSPGGSPFELPPRPDVASSAPPEPPPPGGGLFAEWAKPNNK